MPAPPTELVKALRNETVARHIFFSMTHSQGTIRCWDGIGDFKLLDEVYTGIGGGHEIEGISDSGDIQNHTITAKLNRVPFDALMGLDPDIRGREAIVRVAWLRENGTLIVPPRIIAKARGSHLLTDINARDKTLTAVLRGPLAEWMAPPRATYSTKDQQRRFAGDTGFDFTKLLENATTTGWSRGAESEGGVARYAEFAAVFVDSVAGQLIGDHSYGLTPMIGTSPRNVRTDGGANSYVEETTGTATSVPVAKPWTIQVGGNDCVIDANGDLKTTGGKLVFFTNSSHRLRVQGQIIGNGSPTADTILSAGLSVAALVREGGSVGTDLSALVYCSKYGRRVFRKNGTVKFLATAGEPEHNYVEAVTGLVPAFDVVTLQVGGSDCFLSDTGVVLTPAGRRIIKVGDPDAFLRVWT